MRRIEVVAAVIEDETGRILLSERRPGKEFSGMWEFPGGKIEAGETPMGALQRELLEELGIEIKRASRFITTFEASDERQIEMQVWRVHQYQGKLDACENQQLCWLNASELLLEHLPPLDRPVARALQLPRRMLITPDPALFSRHEFIANIVAAIARGYRFFRLRANNSEFQVDKELIQKLEELIAEVDGILLLGTAEFGCHQSEHTGLHLRSSELATLNTRPVDAKILLSAAVHCVDDIRSAERLTADLLTISPIKATTSHPGINTIGWPGFMKLHKHARAPAFALGGLTEADAGDAIASGALGIAAIRAFWPNVN